MSGFTKKEIQGKLKVFFDKCAVRYKIEAAFLFGSYSPRGFIKKESDVDVAVVFDSSAAEEDLFNLTNDLSIEIGSIVKKEVDVIPICKDFRKPMLYYNAIILGFPLYIRDKAGYARLFNEALYQMEDFSLFGARMQLESARHLFKEVDHG